MTRLRRTLAAVERRACDLAPAHPALSRTAMWWAHSGPTARNAYAGAAYAAVALLYGPFGIAAAVTLWAILVEAERVSAAVHMLADEDGIWCPRCHRHDDDNGPGGTDPGDEPYDGPDDPFTADEMHMLEFQYRTEDAL